MTSDLAALMADPRRVVEVPLEAVVTVLGDLERLRVSLWAHLLRSPTGGISRAATAAEADRLLTIPAVAMAWFHVSLASAIEAEDMAAVERASGEWSRWWDSAIQTWRVSTVQSRGRP